MTDLLTTALIGAGAAVIGGLLSGAYQHARDWWSRPRLQIDYSETGGRVEVEYKEGDSALSDVYVRVRVRNVGQRVATGCQIFLATLDEVQPSGTTSTPFHDSMPLEWSAWGFEPGTFLVVLCFMQM